MQVSRSHGNRNKPSGTPINSLYAVGAVVGHLGDTDIINPCSVHTALARIAGTHAAETVE